MALPNIEPGLAASFLAAAISSVGLLSMAALGDWGKRNSPYFSAFAIGVLLVAILFHLTPEALTYSAGAINWMVAGFFAMVGIGMLLRLLTQTDRNVHGAAFGYASIVALGFHSFVDGLIYEATFHAELFTGAIATMGLLLHEFPEGVIAYFLARGAGLDRPQSVFWAFIAASATTVAGAFVAMMYIERVDLLPLGPLLGLAAGGLLYIIIFHLAPHASGTPHRRGYIVASLGVAIGLAAIVLHSLEG
ncbi:MAG: ZIP family metal transporter [Parvularculaceae bacterium]